MTGGYIYVPVLVDDAGKVFTESRDICEHLLAGAAGARLVPSPCGRARFGRTPISPTGRSRT